MASAHMPPSGPVSCTPISSTAVSSSVPPPARSSCCARIRRLNTCRRSSIVLSQCLQGPGLGALLAHAELAQHPCPGLVVRLEQAEQDVLGADVVVAQTQRRPYRELLHLLEPRG